MQVTNNETYDFCVIPVKKNSAYENDKDSTFTFKGRPANTQEKKKYRLQQGVNISNNSVYIFATNLPNEIKPGDRIKYLGQMQVVESVGYYYDLSFVVNANLFNDEYIIAQCPKGLTLV